MGWGTNTVDVMPLPVDRYIEVPVEDVYQTRTIALQKEALKEADKAIAIAKDNMKELAIGKKALGAVATTLALSDDRRKRTTEEVNALYHKAVKYYRKQWDKYQDFNTFMEKTTIFKRIEP